MENIKQLFPILLVLGIMIAIVIVLMLVMTYALFHNTQIMRQLREVIAQSNDEANDTEQFSSDQADQLFEKGDISKLNTYCEHFIEETPNSVHANWYYALAHYSQGDYEIAREYFEKVIRINPLWRDGAIVYLQEIANKIGMSNHHALH